MKKIFCLILSLVMVLGLTVNSFAEENGYNGEKLYSIEDENTLEKIKSGELGILKSGDGEIAYLVKIDTENTKSSYKINGEKEKTISFDLDENSLLRVENSRSASDWDKSNSVKGMVTVYYDLTTITGDNVFKITRASGGWTENGSYTGVYGANLFIRQSPNYSEWGSQELNTGVSNNFDIGTGFTKYTEYIPSSAGGASLTLDITDSGDNTWVLVVQANVID